MKLFQKKWTKLLLTLALCLALFASFAACGDPGTSPTPSGSTSTQTDKTLISNGYFANASGTTLPKTPTNWSGQSGTGNGGSAPYTTDDVLRGTVSVGSVTSADPSLSGKDPGKADNDDKDANVLMIYNKNATAYRYRSASFAVSKGATVEVSVDVWTKLESGAAKIVITDGKAPFYTFEGINTNGTWQTYTITLQGNLATTKYIYVELWLGEGGKDDTATHAKGVAYFDNVTAYKTDMSDTAFDEIVTDADTQKYSLRLLNLDFTRQHTSNSKKNYATDWNTLSGGATSTKVEGVQKNVNRGIYNATDSFTLSDSTSLVAGQEGSTDGKILGIESPFKTAIGYKSSALYVAANSYYKLSVYVKTADVVGQGAYIRLTDVDNTEFSAISTDGDWTQYNYYVKGSATQSKTINLELWLGEGSSTHTDNYTSGYAFFDTVTFVEIDEDEMIAEGDEDDNNILVTELWNENLITTAPTFADFEYVENHGTPNTPGVDQIASVVSVTDVLDGYDLTEAIGGIDRENEDSTAYMLYHKKAGATFVSLSDASVFTINPNQSYRLSFWVRTIGVEEGKGLNVYLTDATDSDDVLDVATLSKINTECFDDECEETHEAWQEVTFYVRGDANDVKNVSIRLALGSGNAEDPSSYVKGHVFVSNFYLESVTNTEYTSATSTGNLGKYSFFKSTTSTTTVPNGGFDNFVAADSELIDGQLKGKPGAVDSWEASKNTGNNAVAGITNKAVFDYVKTEYGTFPVATFPYDTTLPAIYNGQPNLLMIWNQAEGKFSYTSPASNLAANSYYRISVQAKTVAVLKDGLADGAYAFVTLQTADNKWVVPVNTNGVADNDGWVTVDFYVSNGFAATSVDLVLSVGTDTALASGAAFFDNVVMTAITEEEYDEAVEGDYLKVVNLSSETFDTSALSYPTTPSEYTGATGKNSPSGTGYTISGVINLDDTESLQEYYEAADLSALTTHFGGNHSAPYFLLIHNKQDTAFAYTRSNISLAKSTTYLIKIKAMTMGLANGDSGKITINLGDDDSVSLTVDATEWTDYSFYITTNSEKAATAKLILALGEGGESTSDSTKWVTGAIGFDDLVIEKVDEVPDTLDIRTQRAYTIPEPETEDEDPDDKDPVTGPSATQVIEVVVASLLSIAVIVVLAWALVKKLAPKVKAKKNKKFARPTKANGKKKSND